MDQPAEILKNGTRIQVHNNLGDTKGMLIKEEILTRRTPGITGRICGIVGGHGGDVYWVRHDGEEDTGSAYGWWEFELRPEPKPAPSRYERLMEE